MRCIQRPQMLMQIERSKEHVKSDYEFVWCRARSLAVVLMLNNYIASRSSRKLVTISISYSLNRCRLICDLDNFFCTPHPHPRSAPQSHPELLSKQAVSPRSTSDCEYCLASAFQQFLSFALTKNKRSLFYVKTFDTNKIAFSFHSSLSNFLLLFVGRVASSTLFALPTTSIQSIWYGAIL